MDRGTLRVVVGDPAGIGQIAGYLGRVDELSDGLAVRVVHQARTTTALHVDGEPIASTYLPAAAATNPHANLAVITDMYDFVKFIGEIQRFQAVGLRLRHRITTNCHNGEPFAEHGDIRTHIRDVLRTGGTVLVEGGHIALHTLVRLDVPPWAGYVDHDLFEVIVTVAAKPGDTEDDLIHQARTFLVDNGGPASGVTLVVTDLQHVFPEVASSTTDENNVIGGFQLRVNDQLHTELLLVGTSPTTVIDLR